MSAAAGASRDRPLDSVVDDFLAFQRGESLGLRQRREIVCDPPSGRTGKPVVVKVQFLEHGEVLDLRRDPPGNRSATPWNHRTYGRLSAPGRSESASARQILHTLITSSLLSTG